MATYGIGLTQAQFKTQLQNEFNNMIESVKANKGFYIGRYETSWTGTAVRSVQNEDPMTAEVTSGNTWWGMYTKQKAYTTYNNMTGATSSMIWGSQWCQVMIWMKDVPNEEESATIPFYILDSHGMGWYSDNSLGSRKNTGTLLKAKVKNI